MAAETIDWLYSAGFTIFFAICLYSFYCKQQRKRKLLVYMSVVDAQRNLLDVLTQEGIVPEKSTDIVTEQQNKIVGAKTKLVVALAKLRNEI